MAITNNYSDAIRTGRMPASQGTWLGTGRRSDGSNALEPLDATFEGEERFESAQPLTVRFRGAMIRAERDPILRGENDLLVVTNFKFGDEPPVDRLHYMGSDDATGWHGDFFRDTVLSIRDLTKDELTVRIQVYDVDGVDREVVDAVRAASSRAAVAFPQLTPYAAAARLGIGPIVDLVDNLDDHDAILDSRITLRLAAERTRAGLLQPGYFVHFPSETVADGLSLDRSLRVRTADGAEYADSSYAVLGIAREHAGGRDWEIDQKAAKLIAELNGKGQSGKAALEFLQDTLGAYSDYRRLDRAAELASKETLTEDEAALLDDYRSDPALRPFIGRE